ncbi:MAG: glycoside hydrolase family protein [uncultured bacterium]|nr:MAG: glycoside hydrolase family protein [uncultured bacterium]
MNFGGRLFFFYEIKEALLDCTTVRLFFSAIARLNVWKLKKTGRSYEVLAAALRVERDFSAVSPDVVPLWVHRLTQEYRQNVQHWRDLVRAFQETELARFHSARYRSFDLPDRVRIRQPKNPPPPERQGDLLVLKPWCGTEEKGVILLNFDETVDKFFSLFDVEKVATKYRLVVEPSAWGYQQVRMYLLRGLATDVVIQAQYRQDYEYIDALGGSLRPIRLGAGDWADPELFQSGRNTDKKYDLVMIANWLKWKRHKLLFRSMRDLQGNIGRVALIGYPIEGRTSDEIRLLAARYGVAGKIDLFENVSATEVGQLVRSAKVGIMLSKKEGANRGIYECFFSDVPVILSSSNIGVNRDHINKMTGVVSSDSELAKVILYMVGNYDRFAPREWALNNTGTQKSSAVLNSFLRDLAEKRGEVWKQDIFPKKNAPNPLYLSFDNQKDADREIDKLAEMLL